MRAIGGSRRAWGWHRLTDEWAARIVASAHIRPGDLVLEIGAGCGSLTGPLVRAGARVLAIELHPRRAEVLRRRFSSDAVTVVEADARELLLPHKPFRVVSNPPYSMSSTLLRVLTARRSKLLTAHLVLQRALVQRTVTGWHDQSRWHAKAGMSLPRRAFQPPPHVDSSVLLIHRQRFPNHAISHSEGARHDGFRSRARRG